MKQNQIQLAGAPVMVKGIKGDWHVEKARLKQNKCPFDAGFDIYPDRTPVTVTPLGTSVLIKIGTSVHFCFPVGTYGLLCERSSSNEKLAGARIRPGVFDSGYTGECFIIVMCDVAGTDMVLAAIDLAQKEQLALAQMIVMPVLMPVFSLWDDKKVPPGRGANGFGHSDVFMKG